MISTQSIRHRWLLSVLLLVVLVPGFSTAAESPPTASATDAAAPVPNPKFDAQLAKRAGADLHGMRNYVLVILKSSTTPMPKGPERDAMFQGHFANMQRLSDAGILKVAGPLDGVDGWRGLFVLAVETVEEAKEHVATDPVIKNGEMVAEYHRFFSSAALMLIPELHEQVAETPM
ncbi:hypothetical protein C7S18_06965 [Ahniella affigens]|uniref:YCII-related domain-containing protein n=1 Tax=Ahniella affigens TaxID=2021234 RepID=A0A2P1PQ39_9GAMM|nr:YciI family protein [Ahniella affigens]AVP96954.1 hypothetical protein C7S18_06965 [Ahniella affigens]